MKAKLEGELVRFGSHGHDRVREWGHLVYELSELGVLERSPELGAAPQLPQLARAQLPPLLLRLAV